MGTNIWGTKKDASIEGAVTQLIERRQCIRVAQVELVETGRVFRARDGMVLELLLDPDDASKHCVRVAIIGTTVHAYIEGALVVHAGEEAPTAGECAAAAIVAQKARIQYALEAEVEARFERITTPVAANCNAAEVGQ